MKKLNACLLALLMAVVFAVPAMADTYTYDGLKVAFGANNAMTSNFDRATIDTLISDMQPGDDAVITLKLKNNNPDSTSWYMTNKILQSLEDTQNSAAGGAYTYYLAFKGPSGEQVLYDSNAVGGENTDNGEGLHKVKNLDEYVLLDTLAPGQGGTVTLHVGLDGETQGNGYQESRADLQMNFAVELNTVPPNILTRTRSTNINGRRTTVVYTGDADMTPYLIAAAISGLLLLAYALYSYKTQKQRKRGRAK